MFTSFLKPVVFHRPFAKLFGVLGALVLTQAIQYEATANAYDTFSKHSIRQFRQDTMMSDHEIEDAVHKLTKAGVIECREAEEGVIEFKVHHAVLEQKIEKSEKVEIKPAKKEPEPEQLTLIPEPVSTESSLTVIEPDIVEIALAGEQQINYSKLSNKDLEKVFLAAYLRYKPSNFVNHDKIYAGDPKKNRAFNTIKGLVKTYPYDALNKFIAALTYLREGNEAYWREGRRPLTHLTSNGKINQYADVHYALMETDVNYRARVEGSGYSKDLGFVAPDIKVTPEAQQAYERAHTAHQKQQEIASRFDNW